MQTWMHYTNHPMLGQQCYAFTTVHLGSSYSKAVAACKFGGRNEVARGWTIAADINGNKKLTLL